MEEIINNVIYTFCYYMTNGCNPEMAIDITIDNIEEKSYNRDRLSHTLEILLEFGHKIYDNTWAERDTFLEYHDGDPSESDEEEWFYDHTMYWVRTFKHWHQIN